MPVACDDRGCVGVDVGVCGHPHGWGEERRAPVVLWTGRHRVLGVLSNDVDTAHGVQVSCLSDMYSLVTMTSTHTGKLRQFRSVGKSDVVRVCEVREDCVSINPVFRHTSVFWARPAGSDGCSPVIGPVDSGFEGHLPRQARQGRTQASSRWRMAPQGGCATIASASPRS